MSTIFIYVLFLSKSVFFMTSTEHNVCFLNFVTFTNKCLLFPQLTMVSNISRNFVYTKINKNKRIKKEYRNLCLCLNVYNLSNQIKENNEIMF